MGVSQPVLFRAVSEPERGGSRHLLAITASVLLLATTGAAGYRYLYQRHHMTPQPAPTVSQPPPQAQETPAAATTTGTEPPSSTAESTPSPTRKTQREHPPRAISHAVQVEAEAARSEAEGDDAGPGSTQGTTPATGQNGTQSAHPASGPQSSSTPGAESQPK